MVITFSDLENKICGFTQFIRVDVLLVKRISVTLGFCQKVSDSKGDFLAQGTICFYGGIQWSGTWINVTFEVFFFFLTFQKEGTHFIQATENRYQDGKNAQVNLWRNSFQTRWMDMAFHPGDAMVLFPWTSIHLKHCWMYWQPKIVFGFLWP